jgi:hypothetical protein
MRGLGDKYAKDEFRKHQAAKPEFLVPFFREWDKYVAQLNQQTSVTGFGASLDVDSLTDEQRVMLAKLAQETTAAGKNV